MRAIIVVMIVLLLSLGVLAESQQGEGIQGTDVDGSGDKGMDIVGTTDSGQGQKVYEVLEGEEIQEKNQNKGEDQIQMMQEQIQTLQKEGLKQKIQNMQQEITQELKGMDRDKQKVYQNQNQVRLAVHSLLEMKELLGGIGPQVREIAQNFNNSIRSTLKAEEKIEKRSSITRFFAGGNHEAAQDLEQQISKNKERISELKQLRQECECDEEVGSIMQEQIQSMEQEQVRLQELALKEKKSKGIIGWLWK